MKNRIISLSTLLFIVNTMYSQVGINTTNPKATLDVVSNNTNGNTPEGFIAPRLSGDQIKLRDTNYGSEQTGSIIYATSPVTSPSTKTVNITSIGYYYFDGSLWQNIVNGKVDKTSDSWVDDSANIAIKLGSKSDGISARPAGTDFVIKDNGFVGIGTDSPQYKLHLFGDVAFPNVANTTVIGPYSGLGINQNTGEIGIYTPGSQPTFVSTTSNTGTWVSWSSTSVRIDMPINENPVELINTLGAVTGISATGKHYIQVPSDGLYRFEVSSMYYRCSNFGSSDHLIHIDELVAPGDETWTVVDSPRIIFANSNSHSTTTAHPVNPITLIRQLQAGDRVAFQMRNQNAIPTSSNCGFEKPISSENSILISVSKL